MNLATFTTTILTITLFIAYVIITNRNNNKLLRLEQEKALRIGYDEGANWVLDMSVEEYVNRQAIRRETKT